MHSPVGQAHGRGAIVRMPREERKVVKVGGERCAGIGGSVERSIGKAQLELEERRGVFAPERRADMPGPKPGTERDEVS